MSYNYFGGKGYIGVPSDIEREDYIKDCYANNWVSMWTEKGGFHNRVPISPEVLNFITFPEDEKGIGSPVMYLLEQEHNKPTIVARYISANELGDNRENQFKFSRKLGDKSVEIIGSSEDGHLTIAVDSDDDEGQFFIRLLSKNENCNLKIEVQGNVSSIVQGNVELTQYGIYTNKTFDEDESNSAEHIQTATENKFNQKKFYLNDGDEPMMLGNKTNDFLDKFITEISNITTTTMLGQMPILNKAQVLLLKKQLKPLLSQKAFID